MSYLSLLGDPIAAIALFGMAALGVGWILIRRKYEHRYRLPEELGRTVIVARHSPKVGGFMALYDDFLVHQPNMFSNSTCVPYKTITRLGVENHRWVNTAAICLEYRDENGNPRLAQFVCVRPEEFVSTLRRKIDPGEQ